VSFKFERIESHEFKAFQKTFFRFYGWRCPAPSTVMAVAGFNRFPLLLFLLSGMFLKAWQVTVFTDSCQVFYPGEAYVFAM
jgi:hypothetical protein